MALDLERLIDGTIHKYHLVGCGVAKIRLALQQFGINDIVALGPVLSNELSHKSLIDAIGKAAPPAFLPLLSCYAEHHLNESAVVANDAHVFSELPLLRKTQEAAVSEVMKTKVRKIAVPVFQTLLVKKLCETNGEVITLAGTIIQRVLYYDLAQAMEESGFEPRPYFNVRFNDRALTDPDQLVLRRTMKSSHVVSTEDAAEEEDPHDDSVPQSSTQPAHSSMKQFEFGVEHFQQEGCLSMFSEPNGADTVVSEPVDSATPRLEPPRANGSDFKSKSKPFLCVSSTFQLDVPLRMHTVFEGFQGVFRVVAVELLVELPSCFGKLDGEDCEFLPDFVCHGVDKRNLVSVRDWFRPELLDEMNTFDFINTSPTVEYHIEGSAGGRTVPKMKLTWYLRSSAIQSFLDGTIPALYAALCNTFNINFSGFYDNFLTNALTIGLSAGIFVPNHMGQSKFSDVFRLEQLYLPFILLGTCLSVLSVDPGNKRAGVGEWESESEFAVTDTARQFLVILSNMMMWGAPLIPIFSLLRYKIIVNHLKTPHVADPTTFNGRPKSIGRGKTRGSTGGSTTMEKRLSEISSATAKIGSQVDVATLHNFYIPDHQGVTRDRGSSSASAITENMLAHSASVSGNADEDETKLANEGRASFLTQQREETALQRYRDYFDPSWDFQFQPSTDPSKEVKDPSIVYTGLPRQMAIQYWAFGHSST